MSIAIESPATTLYSDTLTRGSLVKARVSFVFPPAGNPDSKNRVLELRLSQSEPDEDADIFDNLLLPLTVLLIEQMPGDIPEELKKGFEDLYYFAYDGDFIRHKWRHFIVNHKREKIYFVVDPTGKKNYSNDFEKDEDPSKLFRYGEQIKSLLKDTILEHQYEIHPTVQGLKNHTLWKHFKQE